MGIQKNWHDDYFKFNTNTEYKVDYKLQKISRKDEANKTDLFADVKNKYKISEDLYYDAKLDSNLLSRVINDRGWDAFSIETKKLILRSKLHSLKPLMVNASSASRRAELQGYIDEEKTYQQKLDKLNSSKQETKQVSENNEISAKKPVKSLFESANEFLERLFILSPLAFVRNVGEFNLFRLSYRFSLISWNNIWTYLQSINILDASSKLHGIFVDIAMMNHPTLVFNALSVLIFVLKLAINITLPIKHLFAPTNRVELGLPWWTRAKIEMQRVWDIYFNDIFWMIFNGITNFPLLVGLSIPVANWILTGALFFDVLVLSGVWFFEERKIANEIAWLNEQISLANNSLKTISQDDVEKSNKEKNINAHIEMYKAMINQSQVSITGTRAAIIACILATALFIASLALVLSLATPLMAPIGFFACVLAVAVILARKDISKYAEAKKLQSIYKDDEKEIKAIRAEEARKAGWQLAKTLIEHILVPMFIIGLYALNWPAAVAFTALYIGVKASGVKLTSFESSDKLKKLEIEDGALLDAAIAP